MTPLDTDYIPARAAAERLGVCRQRIYQLVHRGHLPHVWIGTGQRRRVLLILRQAVLDRLDAKEAGIK